jgi:hypothetical protein
MKVVPYHIKFTRKRKRFLRSNVVEEIIVEQQCPGAGALMENYRKAKQVPLESWEDNYRRALLFYKTVKDSNGNVPSIPLDKPYLDKKEEDKFVAEWKAFLNDRTQVGSYSTNAEASLHGFLGVDARKMNLAQFDRIVANFNLGWSGRDGGPLLAFGCKKRGNPGQGGLSRFINNILAGPEYKQILLQKERIFCKNVANSYAGPNAQKLLKNICLNLAVLGNDTISAARNRNIVGDNDIIELNNSLYILTNDDPENVPIYGFGITSECFEKMPLYFTRIFVQNHIEDIHPQLGYLIWKDMGLRKIYWSKAFRGNYMPPNRVIPGLEKYKDALDALYFAICYYSTFIGTDGLVASSVANEPATPTTPILPNNNNMSIEAMRAAGTGLTTGGANIQSAQAPMLPKDFYALPNREKFQIIYQNLQLLAENDPKITAIFDIAQWAIPAPGFFSKKVTIREVLRAKYPGRSDKDILLDIVEWYRENPNSSGFLASNITRPIASRWFGGAKGKKTRNRHKRSSRHSRKHITKKCR